MPTPPDPDPPAAAPVVGASVAEREQRALIQGANPSVGLTPGHVLRAGARWRLALDLRHTGGMPSHVDTRPFRVGETVAVSRGAVIHRTPMFELIQYTPSTPMVRSLPTVVVPPQINRYYSLDLAPGRSFVEYAVSRGIQTFM